MRMGSKIYYDSVGGTVMGIVTDTDSKYDNVYKPIHYNQGSIECIDAMISAFGEERVANYCIGNVFKYIWRSELKNGIEDLNKALWYLNKAIYLKCKIGNEIDNENGNEIGNENEE